MQGLVTRVSLPVLESLADEHWYALSDRLVEDIDAKEIRLGVLVVRGQPQQASEVLINEDGVALQCSAVPSAVEQLGSGLLGLKRLAQLAAEELVQHQGHSVELVGYFNDDQLAESRPYVTLIYRVRYLPKQGDQIAAPHGYSWVGARHTRHLPLEPISRIVIDGLAT